MENYIRSFLLLGILLVPAVVQSQDSAYLAVAPHVKKTYWLGSIGENSIGLAKDKNDNVYMATCHRLFGERLDTAIFTHKANYDESISAAVIKHNPQGKIVWANTVVSRETRSEATAIALDAKGNVVV